VSADAFQITHFQLNQFPIHPPMTRVTSIPGAQINVSTTDADNMKMQCRRGIGIVCNSLTENH